MTDKEHDEWIKDELERKRRAEPSHIHHLLAPLPGEDDAERLRRQAEEEEELKKKKLAEEEEEDDDDEEVEEVL